MHQYLDLVKRNPKATRSAFERMYDMILAAGTTEYIDNKKKIVHYNFFDDTIGEGHDAIYGLDIPLMKLVNIFKSAAQRYGTERRVILLHGPVGSSKSTIARLLKAGLEEYSCRPEGAMYTFGWIRDLDHPDVVTPCPMHEEPLHLVSEELRPMFVEQLNDDRPEGAHHVKIEGEFCPFCRQEFKELSDRYNGDWARVTKHIRVRPPAAVGAGPHRYRHIPTQGREEPGQHRADRGHQLPQDCRVWIGFGSARFQF